MKGIVLAGGAGTRLYPCTKVVSKQLMPVFDKPMIYYPLSVLMLAGIREVLVISTPHDLPLIKGQLGDPRRLGMRITYAEQPRPEGIAQAFTIGRDFIGGDSVCLILGDNVLYGNSLTGIIRRIVRRNKKGGTIFAYPVREPQRYGVVSFNDKGRVTAIEEKPKRPKSHYAVPGIYIYGPDVVAEAGKLRRGKRGEYEITDLNKSYLKRGRLTVYKMGRGIAWLDTGTPQSLLEASSFVRTIQERQGLMVACLEEIAWANGWIGLDEVKAEAAVLGKSSYADYLWDLVKRGLKKD